MSGIPPSLGPFDLTYFREGILRGDRIALGKAITLTESTRPDDRRLAEELIDTLLPHTGKSIRIGVTGSPGVGKSTFIESLGLHITRGSKKIAVLTIDPSSQRTKGSILGDKTRMEELSKDDLAFIRPSPAGDALGGVNNGTRESILLCEAAGFSVIIVETVGVGQSEVAVRGMVDFFLLLMLPGSGDELQGIKKGIMEMADGLVITKADGENKAKATTAQSDFKHALHLFQPPVSGWVPPVLLSSAVDGIGVSETWTMINEFKDKTSTGFFTEQRKQQHLDWFHESLHAMIRLRMLDVPKNFMTELEAKVLSEKMSPNEAARQVLENLT